MASARAGLRVFQETQERDSRAIVKLTRELLLHGSSPNSDIWNLYEQGFIAGLDTGDSKLMLTCMNHLNRRFKSTNSDSSRLRRLHGLDLEARGNWEEAEQLYDSILASDESNTAAQKRKIAILMAQHQALPDGHKRNPAIKALNLFLQSNMGDFEAWTALGNLYINEHLFLYAAFCFEELILSNPLNYLFHLVLAEIMYTCGKTDVARKYFAQAVAIHKDNARALLGLHLAHSRSSKSANTELKAATEKALLKLYAGKPNEALMKSYLKSASAATAST